MTRLIVTALTTFVIAPPTFAQMPPLPVAPPVPEPTAPDEPNLK